MWNYKEGKTAADAQKVKAALEGMKSLIPEIVSIQVHINQLSYSTKDVMLDVTFADEAAFLVYMEHPDHVAVFPIVGECLTDRTAFDYHG